MYLIIAVILWIKKIAEGFYGGMWEVLLFKPSANVSHHEAKAIMGDIHTDKADLSEYDEKHFCQLKELSNHMTNMHQNRAPQLPTGNQHSVWELNACATACSKKISNAVARPLANTQILRTYHRVRLAFDAPVSKPARYQVYVGDEEQQMQDDTWFSQKEGENPKMETRYRAFSPSISDYLDEAENRSKSHCKVYGSFPRAASYQCDTPKFSWVSSEESSVNSLTSSKNGATTYSNVDPSKCQSDCQDYYSVLNLEHERAYHSFVTCHYSGISMDEDYFSTVCVNTFKQEFRKFYSIFSMQMPIYVSNSGSESLWHSTKRVIKHYAMFGGKNKKKRKKIHSETVMDSESVNGNMEHIISTDRKSLMGGNIEEIFHEAQSIIEGPAEVPLMQPPTNTRRNQRQLGEPREVADDGIVYDHSLGSPGQQTHSIIPGDNRREAYRLSTFEHFPNKVIQTALLAKNGFSYTGYFDRVKCFSCGAAVESWEPRDNPADRKWHKGDCSFMLGHFSGNVPLGGGLPGGFRSSLLNPSTSQQINQTPSFSTQGTGATYVQIPNDLTDFQRGGSYHLQPGQGLVIGPGSQPPSYQTTTTNNPPARNPPRQWRMANVISSDHKRHLTNLYLNRELDRLASFGRWPTGRPNVSPVSLAGAGFFYLGDMDRTQCFSCGGVLRNWSAADIAMEEHRTHFPNCRFVVGVERRNVPVSGQPESSQELAQKYPCRFPMNPHMRSEPSRVQTFDRRWPVGRTRAQPQEIAEAGFFFLGDRDRVKCWYCNGGLQNWEYDDIPWVEHAKWFPNCQFLLAKKGQKFVHDHLSLCPHLPRPIISRQDGAAVDTSTATPHSLTPEERPSSFGQDVPPPGARVRVPTPPPAIIDPQMEQRKRMERIDKEMNESETVKFVKAMGYEESLIRKSLLEKLESGTPYDAENIFDGNAALLDAVMKKEEEVKKEEEEQRNAAAAAHVPPIPPPVHGISFPSISSNYSSFQQESMDTSASLEPISGVHIVSGFDSDDEDIDLYGGSSSRNLQSQPIGAVGGVTLAPSSIGGETSIQSHLWDDVPSDPESMKDFIEQKKEERLCKICFTETADMVFIPCSHMVCCMTCTQALRNCPVCRKKIEKAIKTYSK